MTTTSYTTAEALPAETVAALWRIYLDSFAACEERCVQQQVCYDEMTFAQAAADPDYRKFVTLQGDAPVGFVFATNVPEKAGIAYVNPAFLRAKFPEEVRQGRLWYFTAVSVSPQAQGSPAFMALMAEITGFIDASQGVVLFDTSDESPPIAKMIAASAYKAFAKRPHRTNSADLQRLGGQSYWCLRLETK